MFTETQNCFVFHPVDLGYETRCLTARDVLPQVTLFGTGHYLEHFQLMPCSYFERWVVRLVMIHLHLDYCCT